MDLGLADSVCLVTGSTGGIGLETAELLRAEGATVVTTGRSGGEVRADLSQPGEPERVVRETVERHGRLDVLVNNVGYSEIRKLEDVTDEIWQASFEINLLSAVRATRAALPGMRERGSGTIVNVSSTAAKRPSTGMPDYSVMKAALLSFSRLVADLHAKDGIRCNAVTPGPTATDAWLGEGGLADQQAARSNNTRVDVLNAVGAGRPIGRLAEPEEIAAVICFLLSERASYVTGSAWSADGGTVPIII
jgi:3-oxoacyl-[acyl-carrier protein] reductase